jgi:hypothetical protein
MMTTFIDDDKAQADRAERRAAEQQSSRAAEQQR